MGRSIFLSLPVHQNVMEGSCISTISFMVCIALSKSAPFKIATLAAAFSVWFASKPGRTTVSVECFRVKQGSGMDYTKITMNSLPAAVLLWIVATTNVWPDNNLKFRDQSSHGWCPPVVLLRVLVQGRVRTLLFAACSFYVLRLKYSRWQLLLLRVPVGRVGPVLVRTIGSHTTRDKCDVHLRYPKGGVRALDTAHNDDGKAWNRWGYCRIPSGRR